jgi:hypothetical protein
VLQDLGLPGIADIGAAGLLVLAILMVFTGRLIPRRYYEDAILRLTEDRDNWREAAQELLKQNTELLAKDDISVATLKAIRSQVEGTEK